MTAPVGRQDDTVTVPGLAQDETTEPAQDPATAPESTQDGTTKAPEPTPRRLDVMVGKGPPSTPSMPAPQGVDGAPAAAMTNATAGGTSQTIGASAPHDSALRHVSGRAIYIDDMPEPPGLLHCVLGLSQHAHARIKSIDLTAVAACPGVSP